MVGSDPHETHIKMLVKIMYFLKELSVFLTNLFEEFFNVLNLFLFLRDHFV